MIYDLKNELSDSLPPLDVEDVLGRGTVLQQYIVTVDRQKVTVAGTKVLQGVMTSLFVLM